MQMDVGKFLKFVLKAKEEECREQIRKQWTAMLPLMSIKYLKYTPFEEYYEKCTGANIDMRPAEEIIADTEEARKELWEMREGE